MQQITDMFEVVSEDSKKHLLRLLWHRRGLTAALVFLVLISLLFESIGFAMILPVLEGAIGVDSDTRLGRLFADFYTVVGIEATLSNIAAMFVVVIVVKSVLVVLREATRTYYAYSYKREAMISINRTLLLMDYSDFQKERQGHLLNDTITATTQATSFLIQLIEFVTSIVAVIAFIGVMFMTDVTITAVTLGFGSAFFFVSKRSLGDYSNRVGKMEVNANQHTTEYLAESMALMRDFRLNSLEKFQLSRIKETLDQIVRLEVRWSAITSSLQPLVEVMMVVLLSAYIIYLSSQGGGGAFIEKAPSLGVIVILAHRIFSRASQITRAHVSIVRSYVPFLAVCRYLDCQISERRGLTEVDFSGDISFDMVTVKSGTTCVLDSASMLVPGKKVTGIIGETGSGKSTIVDLLLRLRIPEAGQIRVGSININDIDLGLLRNRIGVVSQSVALRNATILENIRTGNLRASDGEIFEISKALGLHDFILSLPKGYQTMAGDRGNLLSGGQAQRVLIARALLRSPDILVLDESTSALDSETENFINSKVMELMADKTVVIITHRKSVLKYCSRVYSVQNGRISIAS